MLRRLVDNVFRCLLEFADRRRRVPGLGVRSESRHGEEKTDLHRLDIKHLFRNLRARIPEESYLVLLLRDRWFGLGLACCLLILFGVPLFMAKIVRVTPVGVNPEIRISGLDWLQASAFARRAQSFPPEVELPQQLQCWRSAVGNNPGNAGYNRSYLELLIRVDRQRAHMRDAVKTGLWLLTITRTNRADLELATSALDHYRLHVLAARAIEDFPGTKSLALHTTYLRSLFYNREIEKFLAVWESVDQSAQQEPTLSLIRLAIEEAVNPAGPQGRAQVEIDQAKNNVELKLLGHRLQLFVSHYLQEIDSFRKSFEFLVEEFRDEVSDHLLYWDLLWKTGKGELAQAEAKSQVVRPKTQAEVVRIANAYSQLGLREMALRLLSQYPSLVGFSGFRWHAEAKILVDTQRWKELRILAARIRSEPGVTDAFMALSYFLEGRATLELKHRLAAKTAFEKISRYSLEESDLELHVGSNLMKFGYPDEAMKAIWPANHKYRNDLAYWELVLDVSAQLRDGSRLLVASENLWRLSPDTIEYSVNYAAMLISHRIQIEKALSLAYAATIRNPDDPRIRVNYGHALVLASRYPEAFAILEEIDPDVLYASDQQGYYFALMELHYRWGNPEAARSMASKIIDELLLPGDKKVFDSIIAALGSATATP